MFKRCVAMLSLVCLMLPVFSHGSMKCALASQVDAYVPKQPLYASDAYYYIDQQHTLWGWGDNQFGTLAGAYGYQEEISMQNPNKLMEHVIYVTAGQYAAMAIDENGDLWGWGYPLFGHIPQPAQTDAAVKILDQVTQVCIGSRHAMALRTDGTLWAWGQNNMGQLALDVDDVQGSQYGPVMIMENVVDISTYGVASLAVKDDHSLWGWGGNVIPQSENRILPPTKLMDKVLSVEATNGGFLAIKTDQSLWAWGGSTAQRSQVGFYQDLTKILENVVFCGPSVAIQEDGSLWTWGENTFGQLGDDTEVSRSIPKKVMENVLYAGMGSNAMLVINDMGELLMYGGETEESPTVIAGFGECMLPYTTNMIQLLDYFDVKVNDWFYPGVKICTDHQIMIGVSETEFAPGRHLTLEEAEVIMRRLRALLQQNKVLDNYDTVGNINWNTSSNAGWGQEQISRAQFMGMLFEVIPMMEDYDKKEEDYTSADLKAKISEWYKIGILTGTDENHSFDGDLPITRAEVSLIIARILDPDIRVKA